MTHVNECQQDCQLLRNIFILSFNEEYYIHFLEVWQLDQFRWELALKILSTKNSVHFFLIFFIPLKNWNKFENFSERRIFLLYSQISTQILHFFIVHLVVCIYLFVKGNATKQEKKYPNFWLKSDSHWMQ